MRKPRTRVIKPTNENQMENIGVRTRTENEINNVNLSETNTVVVIKEIMEELINSVTTKNELIMNALWIIKYYLSYLENIENKTKK